jgi:hypothetical protein
MKASRLFASSVFFLLFGWNLANLHADTSGPMFGGATLEIGEDTFQWSSASEDGTWHHDVYLNTVTSAELHVTGRLVTSFLAQRVTGDGINGELWEGVYRPYGALNEAGSWVINGIHFESRTQTVSSDYRGILITNTFGNNELNSSYFSEYLYGNGESVWVLSDVETRSSPAIGETSYSGFGSNYTWSYGYTTTYYQGTNSSTYPTTQLVYEHYSSIDGELSFQTYLNPEGNYGYVNGWHTHLGDFTASYVGSFNGPESANYSRSAPAFAPAHLLLNNILATWTTSGLSWDGTVTDSYVDASGGVMLSISGRLQEVLQGSSTATVRIYDDHNTFESTGQFSLSGGFEVYGWNIASFEGQPNSVCWFVNNSSLFVNGTEYRFRGGYSDDELADGSQSVTDVYSHPSMGIMTITGTTESPDGQVQVTYGGAIYSGFYEDGVFAVDGLAINVQQPTAPTFAPARLWVNSAEVNWIGGELNTQGVVTDRYHGTHPTSAVDVDLIISGEAGSTVANVTIDGSLAGTCGYWANFAISNGTVQTFDPSLATSPWFINCTALWINATEYVFSSGHVYEDQSVIDTYVNSELGTVTISGTTASHDGDLQVLIDDISYSGDYINGVFNVSGLIIDSIRPNYGPPLLWVNGLFYASNSMNLNVTTYNGPSGQSLTFSPDTASAGVFPVSGSDGAVSFSGYYHAGDGIYSFSRGDGGPPMIAFAANADGSLQLPAIDIPASLPPGVMVPGYGIWQFLGVGPDDRTPGVTSAYYGPGVGMGASPPEMRYLLKIQIDVEPGKVVLTDYSGSSADLIGSYSTGTHLFQADSEGDVLPVPTYAVDPLSNNMIWGRSSPPTGRPATVIVNGETWRYGGSDGSGGSIYMGYHPGQTLSIGPGARGDLASAALTNPGGSDDTGTFHNNQFTMTGGTQVTSGDAEGTQVPTSGSGSLHNIAADLDIVGNLLSFGSLSDDANVAGAVFQFEDSGQVATLHSILGRPLAEWAWWESGATPSDPSKQVMRLDSNHRLTLFDTEETGGAGIVLDPRPGGSSSIKGVLRVMPAGDIDMGAFTSGAQP